MELFFRQGIVASQKKPKFLLNGTSGIDLNCDSSDTIITIAHGDTDYLVTFNETINNAWVHDFSEGNYWIYWDIDLLSAQVSYGYTDVEPSYGDTKPVSPELNQHYFDTSSNKMFYWDGGVWIESVRLFAGSIVDGLINPNATGSQINSYGIFDTSKIVVDNGFSPVSISNNTDSVLFLDESTRTEYTENVTSLKVKGVTDNNLIASENIPAYSCISFSDNGGVEISSSNNAGRPCIGVVTKNLNTSEYINFVRSGFIKNKKWLWDLPPNTSLYVGVNGEITATINDAVSTQKIGHVVSPNVVYVSIDEQIIKYSNVITPTPTPTVTVTPSASGAPIGEDGFNLLIGTPGLHAYTRDPDIIYNSGVVNLANTAQGTISHPHTDTTLRVFEYKILADDICMCGYGLDSTNAWAGDTVDSIAHLPWLQQTRNNGNNVSGSIIKAEIDDYVYVYTRGQKVWFQLVTTLSGNEMLGGGDPVADTSPTFTLSSTGNLRPLATSHSPTSEVRINTIGGFDNVVLGGIPWDS